MKSTLLPVALLWGTIGLAVPAWAELSQLSTLDEPAQPSPLDQSVQPSASDLLLPEEKITEPFEYDTDALDRLSTQINHSVEVEDEISVQTIRYPQERHTSDGVVIINSDGNVVGGREIPLR